MQALYRVHSAQQRIAGEPAGGQVRRRAAPRGRPAGAAGNRQEGRNISCRVSAPNADEPFLVELRYTVPFDGRSLELPSFPDEVAVQKVYLCVYLPAHASPAGKRRPLERGIPVAARRGLPLGTRVGCQLGHQRRPATDLLGGAGDRPGPAARSFLPDGRRLVFSTCGRPRRPRVRYTFAC